jgi:hypothetical protein
MAMELAHSLNYKKNPSVLESGQGFLQLRRQRGTECFHAGFLLRIDEAHIGTEGLKGGRDGDLVGEQGDAEVAEEQRNQSTQSTEPSGRDISCLCIEKTLFFTSAPERVDAGAMFYA